MIGAMKRAVALLLLASCTGKETPGVLQADSPDEAYKAAYDILENQMQSARMNAASFHMTHYVVLETGQIRQFRETARNGVLDADDDSVGGPFPLPAGFVWMEGPRWIAVTPTGAAEPQGGRTRILCTVTGDARRLAIDVSPKARLTARWADE